MTTIVSHASPTAGARLAPDMSRVLASLETLGARPLHTVSVAEARRQPRLADAVVARLLADGRDPEPEPVAQLEYRFIPGVAGGEIATRIYTPRLSGQVPILLYIHGGGWVVGDLDSHDRSARALCNAAHAVVVSTEYRKAPEHPMPAAWDDTFAAYRWMVEHAHHIGGDASRVVVAGEGAGATLAFDVARRARDEGLPVPQHQVLVCPVAGTDLTTESYLEHEFARPLDKATMAWCLRRVLGRKGRSDDPRLQLAARPASDLAGLPPSTVITAEVDPLRSEGEALARRLEAAGLDVRHRTFEGMTHDFFGLTDVVSGALDAVAFAVEGIRHSLAALRVEDRSTQPVIAP